MCLFCVFVFSRTPGGSTARAAHTPNTQQTKQNKLKSSRIPTIDELTDGAVAALDTAGVPRACVVAHSYGTLIASRLAQRHRDRVASLVLIDPVCFGMFMPHLLRNFVYRTPQISLRK